MNKKGFTLIELVMVIVIIGILAAVAVPRFVSLRRQAQVASCQSDVAALRSALTAWFANYTLNDGCPGTGECDASGYPLASQLQADNTTFANVFLTDGKLPPTSHITREAGDWSSNYTAASGSIDIDATCPD